MLHVGFVHVEQHVITVRGELERLDVQGKTDVPWLHARILRFALALALATPCAAAAIDIAGVTLPRRVELGGRELTLASCGVRGTLWIDHYVAALYVPPDNPPAQAVRDPAVAKLIRVQIIESAYLPANIPEQWREPLREQLAAEPMTRIRAMYDHLQAGDVITISYAAQHGVALDINGRTIVTKPSHELITAMLTAWAEGDSISGKLQRLLLESPCPHGRG